MSYLDINRDNWNKRTDIHLGSDFYAHEDFLAGKTSLKEIELALLGDVRGKKILHLQCHFGQDSISLAHMGAEVTAVDLSPRAIEVGRETAAKLGVEVEFICSDVLDPDLLEGRSFDLIMSTYGTICWHPDLRPWADLISKRLAPGGRLLLIEFHPILDIYDDDLKKIQYSYFNVEEIRGSMQGSYTDGSSEQIEYVVWNHPISDVIQRLMAAGLSLTHFQEYPYAPYPCFPGSVAVGEDRYVIEQFGDKMPMCYSLMVDKA